MLVQSPRKNPVVCVPVFIAIGFATVIPVTFEPVVTTIGFLTSQRVLTHERIGETVVLTFVTFGVFIILQLY